jgi:hypothetical protein
MTLFSKLSKPVATLLLVIFVSAQILTIGSILLIPKPVKATYPTITIANVWQAIKDVLTGIAVKIAQNLANRYLTSFVNKILEKYKIRNYLYYDQILTNYYLTNYIAQKIRDPDLLRVYTLLNAAFITGQPTGLSGQPPSNTALIPQIKQAIYQYYLKKGGTPDETLNNPTSYSTAHYYGAVSNYYLSPPDYTERNLRGNYGGFQSNATTAAQLEVSVGSGVKNGRVLGGTCNLPPRPIQGRPLPGGNVAPTPQAPTPNPPQINDNSSSEQTVGWGTKVLSSLGLIKLAQAQTPPPAPLPANPIPGGPIAPTPQAPTPNPPQITGPTNTPAGCRAAGGTWNASTFDQARAFIDSPAAYIDKWVASSVGQIIHNNYNPESIWTQIGSALGSFLYNQLFLDTSSGVPLNEDPRAYVPESGNPLLGTEIDIDGDGITDGYDDTNDNLADRCVFGGAPGAPTVTGPPCLGSRASTTAPPEQGPCAGVPAFTNYEDDLQSAINEVNATNPGGVADAPNTEDNARAYLAEVVAVLQARGLNASAEVLNGNGNPNTGDLIAIWGAGEAQAERYDAVLAGGAGDRPMSAAATTQYVGTVPVAECIP